MANDAPMTDRFEAQRQLSHPRARVYKNRGVVIELAASYEAMEAESLERLRARPDLKFSLTFEFFGFSEHG